MIDRDLADAIDRLAERIARIRPMTNGDPHAFYEERSEVASKMRAAGEWARTGRRPPELADEAAAGTKREVPIRSTAMHRPNRMASR